MKRTKRGAHQSFLPGLRGGHGQVFPSRIKGVNLDAPVGLRLPQPHIQHLLDVYTLPGARSGLHVQLQGADAYVPAVVRDRHQAGDLQEDGGRLARRAQMHPELRPDQPASLELLSEGEKAALRLRVHLDDGRGCEEKRRRALIVSEVSRRASVLFFFFISSSNNNPLFTFANSRSITIFWCVKSTILCAPCALARA